MADRPVHHLFSYGTLQQPEVQLSQFGRLLDGRPDSLPGHRMTTVRITDPAVIRASGTDQHPMVVTSPDPEDAAEGHVFAITDAELAAADAYEVDDYARVEVTLRSGTRAWVYLDRASTRPVSVREWLRSLEVFAGSLADFDPADAPADPVDLFLDWLREAVAAGVPDAHAMTLSTVGEDGGPDARVLILKNVDGDGWQFAVHAGSPKGRQLADRPLAALTFYWPQLGRQVRVRGGVEPASPEQSAADLLARAPSARAEVLLGRQSDHLDTPGEREGAFRAALARIEAEPDLVSAEWTLYTLVPSQIEFWQADKDRLHNRLRYERADRHTPWERHLLWP
ncbi:pyridoxal 5'-phosphate synthase [Streptomyces sp. S3(2020)]|uniref:pyridoxal 5'-phosphate synthase n=1 Tax=Streptomyces sp. S3(2020) TaxID=2732044 RepID=UPI001489F48F|nr:pyridoxal 5'-phosphate synthase [Streptomyces sp. S3(2020)]NNN30431.1 pyridoxal 5'-phosphate synthase [Streptomyces sp. S3(2020)]